MVSEGSNRIVNFNLHVLIQHSNHLLHYPLKLSRIKTLITNYFIIKNIRINRHNTTIDFKMAIAINYQIVIIHIKHHIVKGDIEFLE